MFASWNAKPAGDAAAPAQGDGDHAQAQAPASEPPPPQEGGDVGAAPQE